jgi:hypothetical protein
MATPKPEKVVLQIILAGADRPAQLSQGRCVSLIQSLRVFFGVQ